MSMRAYFHTFFYILFVFSYFIFCCVTDKIYMFVINSTIIQNCRTFEDLPTECRKYILKVESLSGVSIGLIGVGPKRSQSIIRTKTFQLD